MSDPAKPAPPPGPPRAGQDTPVHEAFARALGITPAEIASAFRQTGERAEEVRRSAAERSERLRAAVRGPAGRFRL